MNLSNYFKANEIISDGKFSFLGYVDSSQRKTLAFCDTIFYLKKANANPNISCIITTRDLSVCIEPQKGIVVSNHPRISFFKLHNLMMEKELPKVLSEYGRGQNCKIHPTALISPRTKIGDHVTIAENVVIKDDVEIGDHTLIDSNAVVGSEGLLYFEENGKVHFIRHAGGVKIGRRVTILSGAVIVKSVHNSLLTTIGNHSIIGVLTNVGHEAQIGHNCVISSNCVIARRCKVSDHVVIGPSSVIREHVTVHKNARVRMGSVVIEDVSENQSVSGSFAVDHKTSLRAYHRMKYNP
jgi:UDP-3-O-[3-hydroxymyristoyl] glucosamine N-acyltransferase